MSFSVSAQGRYTIVRLAGKVDWEDAREIDKAVTSYIDKGRVHLAFVFDDALSICSALIGAIAFNLTIVKKKNGAIYLISSNNEIHSIFENLKFNIVFDGCIFTSYHDFLEGVVRKDR